MALQLSLKGFLANLGLDALLGVHLLQTPILVLQLIEPRHHRGVNATVFGRPFLEAGPAHAMFAAQIRNRNAVLRLLKDRQNLAI